MKDRKRTLIRVDLRSSDQCRLASISVPNFFAESSVMLNFQPQLDSFRQQVTRRWFFRDCGVGLASAALASLLANDRADAATAATNPLAARQPHFASKAKRVIYLFMAGAPSHLELF